MNKKILLIGLVFLLMLSSAFATNFTIDNEGFWTQRTSLAIGLEDLSANAEDMVNGAGVSYDGTLDAFRYDGTSSGKSTVTFTQWNSMSVWIEPDATITTTTNSMGLMKKPASNHGMILGGFTGTATDEMISLVDDGSNHFWYWTSASVATITNAEHNIIFIWETASSNYRLIYDGVDKGLATKKSSPTQLDAGSFDVGLYATIEYDGAMKSLGQWSDAFSVAEAQELEGEGSDFNPYNVTPEPDTAEIFPQVIEAEVQTNVIINSNTYVDIFSEIFTPVNSSEAYSTWVIQLESLNKNTVASCKVLINGTDYNTEVNQTISNGEFSIMYLYSDEFNVTANDTYVATIQCRRDTTGGAQVAISEVEGQITLLATTDGTLLNHKFDTVTANLNSSTFTEIYSSNFTTSNYTATDLNISLVVDGNAVYTHTSTGIIETYIEVDGVAGPISERYGLAGTVNNGAEMDLIKTVSANTDVTVKIFARSTTSDGAITNMYNLVEVFTHDQETTLSDLTNTPIATGTWATIETIYINNSGHTTSDIAVKTEFNIESLSGSQLLYYRIKSGTDFSQEYTLDIDTISHASAVEHHVISNPGNINSSIELQAYTSTSSANITAGSIMAYMVDEISAITQFYTVQARNEWDNVSITDFNVTLTSGTKYISNATGTVSIFHVNGLDTFTVSADDYFNQTITNHDTTTNLTVDMLQSDITFNTTEIITNNTVAGNVTINGVKKLSNASFYLATGTYNATFSGNNYFDKTVLFSVSALDNKTINISGLSGTALNLTFRDFLTNSTQTGITGYFSNEELNLNESFNTGANFYTELSLLQGYNYNVTVVDDDYAITTTTYFVNASVVNETFYLYVTNSVNIFIRDEITREIINDTTFALEFVGDTTAFNASTSNGTYYVDLVTPDAYQLRYYSTSNTNYQLRAYTFELINQSFNEINLYAIESNASLVTVTFNIFSTALEPVEGARIILERYYIGDDGFSQVSSGSTNVDGLYIDFVEAVNAFYRYKVIYEDELKYESPSRGTQFSEDTNLNIYIELFADTYEEYEQIFNIPTTITYTNLTNYTGYFDFSYTNPNLYQLCFEVYINNTDTTETCPTVSASGSVQIPVSVTVDARSVAIASAKAYSSNVGSYVVYKTETESFFPSSAFTEDYNNLFNLGLSIILTIVALVFIRFPVVNVFLQTFVLVLFALIPLPFYTISIVTIGWIVAFNLVILWIVKKDGVPQ